jgi:hypothetical protein
MCEATRLIESLKIRPRGSVTFDSMIESLLAAALHEPVSYVIEHTAPSSVTARVGSDSCNDTDRGLLRTFRTMLARMSYMLSQENGSEFDPYGGDLVARRDGLELAIHFKNTTVWQGIAIARSQLEARAELLATPSWQHTTLERTHSQPQACES